MTWTREEITLEARERGFHLITDEVMRAADLSSIETGLAHFFLKHTSASLTLNENASPAVRADFERHFRRAVPDGADYFEHTLEGPDDMPAHVKASMLGSGLTVPVGGGELLLGTWQGLYLCEHRDHGGARTLVVTAFGEVSG